MGHYWPYLRHSFVKLPGDEIAVKAVNGGVVEVLKENIEVYRLGPSLLISDPSDSSGCFSRKRARFLLSAGLSRCSCPGCIEMHTFSSFFSPAASNEKVL